jgi:uncharacterized protein YukE
MEDRGINEIGINRKIASLEYCARELKTELDSISGKFSELKTYYKGNGMQSIQKNYNDLKSQYSTLTSKLDELNLKLSETISNYKVKSESIYTEVSSTKI